MSELQSLSIIFQNRLFRIPDYQRGYAWLEPQLRDFWEDLINLQKDRYHYTGLLSMKALNRDEAKKLDKDDQWLLNTGYKAYHIVDCPHLLSHAWTLCFHSLNSNRRIRTMTGSVCCQPNFSAKEMNAIQRKFRALVRLLCICRCRHAAKPNKSKTNRLIFAFYICPPWRLSPLFAPLFR